jgi:predicted alpha/beta hydrolase family esterase
LTTKAQEIDLMMQQNAYPTAPVLIVPGLGGSGPLHWQSHMAGILAAARLTQDSWDHPTPESWTSALDAAISQQAAAHAGKKLLIAAHSLGSVLTAHWALANPDKARQYLQGLLLVAPADVDSPDHTPETVRAFAPLQLQPLPVPALLVASTSDPYCAYDRACVMADAWGASLCNVGDAGHINVESGFGPWPLGMALLRRL